jgi:hypothetical protein
MVPQLFTSHKKAFDHFLRGLNKYGIRLTVSNHIDWPNISEVKILENLLMHHNDLFMMTNSCYTQKNFREMHHRKQQSKFKTIQLYNGCGVCLKCLRINTAILLWSKDKHDEIEAKILLKFIKRKFLQKFSTDSTLRDLIKLIDQYT